MQEKLAITIILISLALFALIFVLYRIVNENSERYNKIVLSQRQQEYASRTIPYRRGDIVDRNGTYLATSEKVYNLILDPSQIMDKPDYYLEPTIQALVDVFGFDGNELRGLIQERPKRAYLRYKNGRQLSYDQKEAFEQYQSDTNKVNAKADSKARVKGIWFEDEFKRIYPYNSLACNVIGFATSDGGTGNAVDLCALGLHQSLLEILSRVAGQVDGLVGGVHRHVGNSILGKGHADRHLTHTGSLGGISARRINSSARSGSRRGTCRIPAGSQCTRSHTAHSSRGGQLQKTGTRDFFHCIVLPFSSQQLIRSCVVCTKALYYV